MGITSSKIAQKAPENPSLDGQTQQDPENVSPEEQESIPSTPILTPKIIRENIEKENLDPRSPSKHIARTPIELLPAAAEKLESLTLESTENETPLKKHIILGIDPRSPALEFQRTPIVISASPDKKLPEKIRNKNLDKVLKCALPHMLKNKITPPKLLESCPVTPKLKVDAYKRKSFVLLETNVDFTETDLDDVIKEKYLGKSLQNLCVPGELIDPRSPTTDFPRTPIQISQEVDDPSSLNVQVNVKYEVQREDKDVDIKELSEIPKEETSVNVEKLASSSIQSELLLPGCEEASVVENIPIAQSDSQNFVKVEHQTNNDLEEENGKNQPSANFPENEALLDTCVTESKEIIIATPCKKSLPTTSRQKLVLSPILKQQQGPKGKNQQSANFSENEAVLDTCVTKSKEIITATPCKKSSPTTSRQKLVLSPILKQQQGPKGKNQQSANFPENEAVLDTCVTKSKEIITATPCKKSSPTPSRQKLVLSPMLKQQQGPKSAPVSPPSIVSVTPKKCKSQPVTPPLIDLTADVKELDKKLTHLIYEDEKDLVVCPRIVKVKEQNRTPLGLRNGTENKRSVQKLKVSDKPRKAEYAVSKIPVFKEKKVKVQCENTPPRGMRPKKSQWDAKDDTLVI